MLDKEMEYRKVFYFLKRWAKSPLLPSYTMGYSAGNGDKEPAKKIYDFILSLDKDSLINFEKKLNLLSDFISREQDKERNRSVMTSPFYHNIHSHIKREIKNIDNGLPAQTRRKR